MDSYREIENLIYLGAWTTDEGGGAGESCREVFKHCKITMPDTGEIALGPDLAEHSEQWLKTYAPDSNTRTLHCISNVWIEVDEAADTATSRSYLTIAQAVPQDGFPLQPIMGGIYYDTFVRVDGKWRFDTHRFEPKLIGDLSRHVTTIDQLPLWQRAIYRLTMMFPTLQRYMPSQ